MGMLLQFQVQGTAISVTLSLQSPSVCLSTWESSLLSHQLGKIQT